MSEERPKLRLLRRGLFADTEFFAVVDDGDGELLEIHIEASKIGPMDIGVGSPRYPTLHEALEAAVEQRVEDELYELIVLLERHLDRETFLRVAEIAASEGYTNGFTLSSDDA